MALREKLTLADPKGGTRDAPSGLIFFHIYAVFAGILPNNRVLP